MLGEEGENFGWGSLQTVDAPSDLNLVMPDNDLEGRRPCSI